VKRCSTNERGDIRQRVVDDATRLPGHRGLPRDAHQHPRVHPVPLHPQTAGDTAHPVLSTHARLHSRRRHEQRTSSVTYSRDAGSGGSKWGGREPSGRLLATTAPSHTITALSGSAHNDIMPSLCEELSSLNFLACALRILHRVPKKVSHFMFDNNFGKCGPIFKFFSPFDLQGNSVCRCHKDPSHLQYVATLPCESRKSTNVTKFSRST